MLNIKEVEECMEDARTTLRLLSKKEGERIMISRKLLIIYCNELIMFYEILIVLLKGTK